LALNVDNILTLEGNNIVPQISCGDCWDLKGYKMKPLRNEIVVKAVKQEAKTESGIILDDALAAPQTTGEVLAIGPETKQIQVGDTVLFGEHSYLDLIVDNQQVLFMNESTVYAIIDE
jgi:chaperonin GroES|tara:strand:+ start:31 stop:384 length:354 start_codon:yes stop_codon:yes gene_type:complete